MEDNPAGICSPAGFNGLTQTVYGDLHGSAEMKDALGPLFMDESGTDHGKAYYITDVV
ncbi:MAG: hypothetical protein GY749_24975 [Desulfobacteraceae bacterium]|nr:hypothetical protein [Desulfobacteraceae bacterium]